MALFRFPSTLTRRFLAVASALVAGGTALVAQTGVPSSTDGFNPNVTGSVNVLAIQPDGKIIVGGNYTGLAPNGATTVSQVSGLARLNVDGTIDTTFAPPSFSNTSSGVSSNPQIYAILVDPSGNILIGGTFSIINDQVHGPQPCNGFARLTPTGQVDTGFLAALPNITNQIEGTSTTLPAQIRALTFYTNPTTNETELLVGGAFTASFAGSSISYIALLHYGSTTTKSGTLDATFNAQPNAQVDAITVEPFNANESANLTEGNVANILIGGPFTEFGPSSNQQSMNYMARLGPTGALDTNFNPDPNNTVTSIVVQSDGQIIIAGYFNELLASASSPTTADFIFMLDPDGQPQGTGTNDPPWVSPQAAAFITSIVQTPDGHLIIAGNIGTLTNGAGESTFTPNYVARMDAAGNVDTTFDPSPNYVVNAVAVQPDGSIVLGGEFNQLTPNSALAATNRNGLARVHTDGTLDLDFNPNAFGGIGAIVPLSNGQYLIGGVFSSVNGVSVSNLARLNANGSVDTSFEPNPNGAVLALAVQSNGQIIVGGNFTMIGTIANGNQSQAMTYLARLNTDGSVDTSFDPNPNAQINVIAIQADGQIVVGGDFTEMGVATATVASTFIEYVARLHTDGSIDGNFQPNPSGNVNAILLDPADNAIIIGGAFETVTPASDSYTSTSAFIARLDAGSGQIDINFNPNPNGPILGMAMQNNGQILLCGDFSTVQPNPTTATETVDGVVEVVTTPTVVRQGICRLNSDGSLDQNFAPAANNIVTSIAVNPTNGQVVAGGDFTSMSETNSPSAPGVTCNHIARFDSAGDIDTNFTVGVDGAVDTVQFVGTSNAILVGGGFNNVTAYTEGSVPATPSTAILTTPPPATPRAHIALIDFDGGLDASLTPAVNISAQINAISNDTFNRVVVGGSFTNISGTYATDMVSFLMDGTQDTSYAPNADGPVNAIVALQDGTYFVGGSFQSFGTGPATNFAHLNSDTTIDTTYSNFPTGPNGTGGAVYAIAAAANVQPIIGGLFTEVGTVAVSNVARFNLNGSVDTTFEPNPNGTVDAVAVQSNGEVLIGGSFTTVGGHSQGGIARLQSNGTLDPSFTLSANGTVDAIVIQPDGNILVGGSFSSVGGVARSNIARINANGTLDTTFNPGANGAVASIVLLSDSIDATVASGQIPDQILVGGAFTSIGGSSGSTYEYLARLNANGSLDTTFDPGPNGPVTALGVEVDGKTLVAGSFTSIGGQPRGGFARLPATAGAENTLSVSSDDDTVSWTLAGAPELSSVLVEWSSDNLNWFTLGYATRVGSTDTWQISGLNAALTNFQNNYSTLYNSNNNLVPFLSNSANTDPNGNTSSYNNFYNTGSAPETYGNFYVMVVGANLTSNGASSGLINAIQEFNLAGGTGTVPVLTNSSGSNGSGTITTTSDPGSNPITLPGANLPSGPPVLGSSASVNGVAGGPFSYAIAMANSGGSYSATGLPAGLSINGSTGVISGTPTQAGTFTVTVTTSNALPNSTTVVPLQITIASSSSAAAVAPLSRLVNLSTNETVSPTSPLINGFVIYPGGPKTVLLRAVGPGLKSFGISETLTTPVLQLVNSSGQTILTNEGWDGSASLSAIFSQTGAFGLAPGSADCAVVTALPPGTYSLEVSSGDGSTGTSLAEIYDADPNPYALVQRLVNLSSRSTVGPSASLVGGFVVGGSVSKTLLIRASGPALASFGVSNTLPAPVLSIYASNGELLAENAGWGNPDTVNASQPAASPATIASEAASVSAFPFASGSLDSAVIVTLPPGAYSGQITGAGGQTGSSLYEIYELSQ